MSLKPADDNDAKRAAALVVSTTATIDQIESTLIDISEAVWQKHSYDGLDSLLSHLSTQANGLHNSSDFFEKVSGLVMGLGLEHFKRLITATALAEHKDSEQE